jgi:hypothetical protein
VPSAGSADNAAAAVPEITPEADAIVR